MIRWRPSGLQRQHAFFVLMAWVQRPFVSVSRAVWSVILLAMSLYSTWNNIHNFSELVTPVAYSLRYVEQTWQGGFQWWRTRQDLQNEISALRQKLDILERSQQYHQFLQTENQHLKSMFNVTASLAWNTERVEVLALPFERGASSLWIAATETMQKQQTVVTHEGLIGCVDAMNGHTARVRLITDGLSRLPVYVEGTTRELIVAGQNNHELAIIHQKEGDNNTQAYGPLEVGMKLVTAGYHYLPAHIPVAVISRIDGHKAYAMPLAKLDQVYYVHTISNEPTSENLTLS